jgi:hypothetical protein
MAELPPARYFEDFFNMFFVRHPSLASIEIKPLPAKRRLIERISDNWLFAVGLGMLGLGVLCGLW